MASSPGILPKKLGPQPLKATLPFNLTPTPDAHPASTKIKPTWKSGQRKHSFGRLSPPESSTRIQKKIGIHRTGSLGSLDRSLNYFAPPCLFPPSPVLVHTHIRNSPNMSSTDSEGSSVQLPQSESERTFKRIRSMRSTSLDSVDSIATAKAQHGYPLDYIPLPADAPLKFFPLNNVSDSRRVSLEGVDQEIAHALNGLSISASQPEVCPDGHVAPAPFAVREVQSAGANSSPRSTLDLSPASAFSSRDSPGSACSSSPDFRAQSFVRVHSTSPRCIFNREPPSGAVSVEIRVASVSAGKIQAPDPRKVGIVLAGVGQTVCISASSAFKPIHQFAEATRSLIQIDSPSSSPI